MKHMVRRLACLAAVAGLSFGASAYDDGFVTCDDDSVVSKSFGTRRVYVFTNTAAAATLTASRQLTLEEWLVVGGGGAGGCNIGGGGGGGGVVHAVPRTAVGAGTDFVASVGKGGLAPSSGKGAGGQGGHSSLAFGSISTNAWGGNGGSSWDNVNYHQSWHDDGAVGSGGGLCYYSSKNEEGKTWNPAQGNSGGPKDGASGGHAAGGGGGAGKRSTNVNGGEGLAFDLTGEMRTYGSGGGGGTHTATPGGFGGVGAGDGADGGAGTYATKGTDGLGGGGGGGSNTSTGGRTKSANGGSGTVILVFTAGDHAADETRFTVGAVGDQILVGETVTPEPVVTDLAGQVLTKDTDYTLVYADNDRVGVGRVTVVGREGTPYAGYAVFTKFGIYATEKENEYLALSDAATELRVLGTRVICIVTNTNVAAVQIVARRQLTLEEYLVVGGGGSGGGCIGGGGGGGGVLHAEPRLSFPVGAQMSATVGAGGVCLATGAGSRGEPSKLTFGGIDPIVAFGGNGGGAFSGIAQPTFKDGDVASGGGQGYNTSQTSGQTWNPEQGNRGGSNSYVDAGGGGGAGGAGSFAKGGVGLVFDLGGESHAYGAGGGGGRNDSPTFGQAGGEGAGNGSAGKSGLPGEDGTDGLGGGGGGGCNNPATKGGKGGSGTVILVFSIGSHETDETRFALGEVADQLLVGETVTPEPVVTNLAGRVLAEGTDYTLVYADNDRAGVGTVTATGVEGTPYAGFSASARFGISATGLANDLFAVGDASAVFSREDSFFVCELTNATAGTVLMQALDTLTLESCEVTGSGRAVCGEPLSTVPAGTMLSASVGPAAGRVRLVFSVGDHASPAKRLAVTDGIEPQIYAGSPLVPGVTVRTADGRLLAKDVDYEVSYADNDRVGTGYVIVSGRAGTDFAGFSLRVPFTIRTAYHVTGTALDEEGSGMSWDSPMSLGAAIADAPDGSVILVKAGEYTVPATIAIGKPLDIRGGLAGTDDTTLAADPVTVLDAALDTAVPVLCKVSTTAQGAQNRFSRIVFRNATLRGIGKTGAADLLLEDCAILTNGTVGVDSQANSYGKALRVESASGAKVTLRNCLVQGNRTTVTGCYSGGALYLVSGARVVLENCDFIGNGVQLRYGGGGGGSTFNLYWFSGSAILSSVPIEATGCRFLQNFAEQCHSDGGCVRLNSGAKGSVFRNCVWAGNSGVQGFGSGYEMPAGALLVSLGSRADSITVENCTFAYNVNDCGQRTSAGLTVRTGTVNAKNCVFFGNQLGGGASFKSADVLADANGVCNLSYSLLSADAKTCYDHATGGEVNLGAGVVFGDPLFVTPLADVNARRSGGVYTVNDATVGFLNALDVHLRSPAGTVLNDGTERMFEDELSPAIDAGDPASPYVLEPKPNGHRVNLGAYGNTPWATMSKQGTALIVR